MRVGFPAGSQQSRYHSWHLRCTQPWWEEGAPEETNEIHFALNGLVGICRKKTEPRRLGAAPGPGPGPRWSSVGLPSSRPVSSVFLGSGPSRVLFPLPHRLKCQPPAGGGPALTDHPPRVLCLPARGGRLCDYLPLAWVPPPGCRHLFCRDDKKWSRPLNVVFVCLLSEQEAVCSGYGH